MNTVYIIYEGDAWLSSDSLSPLDVAYSTREKAVGRIIKEIIALRGETKADKDDAIRQLKELGYNQTQGMETNFMIEQMEVR